MRYRLLGPLEVIGNEGNAVPLAGGRERVLVATLVLGANQVVSTGRLVDALWGDDPPATAANALQVHVSKLRKKLAIGGAPRALESTEAGYLLHIKPGEVDAATFEELVSSASGAPAEVAAQLAEAIALWRGPALGDLPPYALRPARVRLEELRLLALERRIDAELALGHHDQVISELQGIVETEPLREGPRRQLMIALYRAGRQADALATYREARDVLAEELGVDPGPELQALEVAILRQDPALEAPSVSQVVELSRAGPPTGTVTLLMSDIEGSTRLWEEHPEEMAAALGRHDEMLRDAIEQNRGYVVKTMGDAFHAAFRTAQEAAATARMIQQRVASEPWPAPIELRVRIALHTGHCEERDGDYYGPAVNRVARLAAVGHGGQVLVSGTTAEILEDGPEHTVSLHDLGLHLLKDLSRPEHVFQLSIEGLESQFPPLRSLDNPRLEHNLPAQLTSFVGRETEIADIRALLETSRLVTLTGVGGSGKTRLALEVAGPMLDTAKDGVWLVELAPLADPALVVSSVASSLGVRGEPGLPMADTLASAISDRHMMLVLDNCEHLLDACAELTELLLRSCEHLAIIATSREPLGVEGERIYRVPPLSLPKPDQQDPDAALHFDGVRLFVDRAQAHFSAFVLDEDTVETVVSLCHKLDGMPLAIELASAQVSSLSIADIDRRLDNRFGLLTRGRRTAQPRQRTLRALIDWSYALLTPEEQAVLSRLSVFAGGCTLDAVESVLSPCDFGDRQVVDILQSLVEKSMVQAEPGGTSFRYRLLETIREYAASKLYLDADGDTWTKAAHAGFFVDLASVAAPFLPGPDQAVWFDALEIELDNVRTAFAFLVSEFRDVESAVRMVSALRDFWFCGYLREGAEMLETALDRLDGGASKVRSAAGVAAAYLRFDLGDYTVAQAEFEDVAQLATSIGEAAEASEAFGGLGLLALRQGDFDTAVQLCEESMRLAQIDQDPYVLAEAHNHRAAVTLIRGDPRAREDALQALSLFREQDNCLGIVRSLHYLAVIDIKANDLNGARSSIQECLELRRALQGMGNYLYATLYYLGLVELLEGDATSARLTFVEVLTISSHKGSRPFAAFALLGLAFCAGSLGEDELAVTLHGAADSLFMTLGEQPDPDLDLYRKGDQVRLRRHLGPSFQSIYQSGQTMALSDAVSLASASC
jgi:predicted ATPase/class 3 adenylate cyclase